MRSVKRAMWAVAMALVCLGCEPVRFVSGWVTDCESDDALVGVRVELYYGHAVRQDDKLHEEYTRPDGGFELGDFGEYKELTLRFVKPGYQARVVHLRGAWSAVEECLDRVAGDDGDAGEPPEDEDAGG